jgi:hypothetical protein
MRAAELKPLFERVLDEVRGRLQGPFADPVVERDGMCVYPDCGARLNPEAHHVYQLKDTVPEICETAIRAGLDPTAPAGFAELVRRCMDDPRVSHRDYGVTLCKAKHHRHHYDPQFLLGLIADQPISRLGVGRRKHRNRDVRRRHEIESIIPADAPADPTETYRPGDKVRVASFMPAPFASVEGQVQEPDRDDGSGYMVDVRPHWLRVPGGRPCLYHWMPGRILVLVERGDGVYRRAT